MVVALERHAAGDYQGCLRALRQAPETVAALQMRLTCATKAGDVGEVRAVCRELRAYHPRSKAARTCGALGQRLRGR
jgi:hypothetical protein